MPCLNLLLDYNNLLLDYNNLLLDYNNLLPDYNNHIIIYYYYNPRININPSCPVVISGSYPTERLVQSCCKNVSKHENNREWFDRVFKLLKRNISNILSTLTPVRVAHLLVAYRWSVWPGLV